MQILLPIHIYSGVIALASTVSALSFKKGKNRHILSGKIFFWAMLGIIITAIGEDRLTLLEILGVGLTIPAITLLIKADLVTEYPFLKPHIVIAQYFP